ncbi:MAG: amino acid adenylation domain-containing protein, partial [Alphaproteobacteria bacterium]|nr:amino acid adenylation domain-containing protein [Alphaproteobacteria bacterium]
MSVIKPKIKDIYPLSPMQEGLLFHSLYAPHSDAYFVQSLFNFEGTINILAFQSAWQKICDSHSIFRTGFFWQDGEDPEQYVLESIDIPFEILDWQGLEEAEQKQKLDAFLQEDRKKGFDLSKPPLFRLTLIQWQPQKYSLIWSQHHILLDGWCLPIVLRDVLQAYEATLQGKEPQFPSRRPFRDYIAWLQHQDIEQAEKFWKDTLHNLEEPTRLSFKGLIHSTSAKDYDTYHTVLSENDTENLRKFAQDHGLTLNTLLQGAVGAVLKAYTRQKEIVLGVTISGRSINLPGIEDMVGLFINTLPLCMEFKSEDTILSFLHTLQQNTQKLNDYAYASLAQVQSWSGMNQSLFDVLFVFENYPVEENVKTPKCGFEIKDVKISEKSEYPLTIAVVPGNQLCLMFSYQTEHFNEDLIKKLAEHIKHVLKGVINSPKEDLLKSIYELPLLTSQEKHQLLIEWNNTKADYPADKTVHQLFEEQVKKTPHNTAVIYENQELSYEQLNAKANQLAHYLRGQGVGPDTLVAIAVERSLEMIIGLLAILKAGGAYVPLDPAYPEDRLQFMLEDTNAPLLITQAHLKERFNSYSGKVFSLQLDTVIKDLFIEDSTVSVPESSLVWINLSDEPSQNPLSLSTPNNLAYVIYTSGSTGKPKGVENTHQAFLNRINWTLANYPISESDSLLYIASMGFDISVWEMLFPLSGGARVIIATEDQTKDIVSLSSLIQAHKVTTLHFVPSLLDLFIASKEGKKCTSLKQIITGGETLLNEVRRNFIDIFKNTNLYLAYGPTEAAISVTHWNCREEGYLTKTPIGTPIANTQLHILDESLNPVPIGVSGEIYIGGVGLARGYLNRPDLTAERFVPNPFVNVVNTQGNFPQPDLSLSSAEQSLRLYRTGDLARYLPNGNIEFLGRIDD